MAPRRRPRLVVGGETASVRPLDRLVEAPPVAAPTGTAGPTGEGPTPEAERERRVARWMEERARVERARRTAAIPERAADAA